MHEKVQETRDIAWNLKSGPKNMLFDSDIWFPPVDHTQSNERFFKYMQPICGYHSLEDEYIMYNVYQMVKEVC